MSVEGISIEGASAVLINPDLVYGASQILQKLVVVLGKEIGLDLKTKKKRISLDPKKEEKKNSLARGVVDELINLKQTLELIAVKTSDAERKQVNDAEVSLWLERLKEAAYDADYILDEYSLNQCEKNVKGITTSYQVAFRLKKAHKIKGITEQLNQIATDMIRFPFQTIGYPYYQHNKPDVTVVNYQVLSIRNLEKVTGIEGVKRAELKDKKNVQLLELHWDGEGNNLRLPWKSEQGDELAAAASATMVLECLQPHPSLKTLLINGFEGLKLPRWINGYNSTSSCLPNLVELNLRNCNSCEQLPSLGLLPCLRVLRIDGMNSVKRLGEEFYYQESRVREEEIVVAEDEEVSIKKLQPATSSSSTSRTISVFRSLIELSLGDMSSLEEWHLPHPPCSYNSFPSLRRLIISGCFQLKSLPLTSVSSLEILKLSNTSDKVVSSILAIKEGGMRSRITSLFIQDSPQLVFLPVLVLQHFKHLRSLEISCCSKLQGFCIRNYNNSNKDDKSSANVFNYTSINSLYSLKFRNCPVLTYLPDLQEWKSLTELWFENCDKLKKSFSNYNLTSLPRLRTLYVDRFIDLKNPLVRPHSTTFTRYLPLPNLINMT